MKNDMFRDLVGFAFFLFSALVSFYVALQQPSILAWLNSFHNLILAYYYLQRSPAKKYDRTGLWLGLIAGFLPTFSIKNHPDGIMLGIALAAYSLILWSLFTLGPRFGVAPADRGLICRGPYNYLRHPMYLGELVFRTIMVFSSTEPLNSLGFGLVLIGIQIWRIIREEKMITGYECYKRVVSWRLIPGVW